MLEHRARELRRALCRLGDGRQISPDVRRFGLIDGGDALAESLDLIMQHAQPTGLDRPVGGNQADRCQQRGELGNAPVDVLPLQGHRLGGRGHRGFRIRVMPVTWVRHQGRKVCTAAIEQVQQEYQLDFGERLVRPGRSLSRAFASGPKAPESASRLTTTRTCAGVYALLSPIALCSATSWAVMDAISGRLVHGTI